MQNNRAISDLCRVQANKTLQIEREKQEKVSLHAFCNREVGGTTWHLDSGLFLVYLRKGNSDSFVAHELFHVCNKILCAAGVNHDADAEPWAYLIGWLTNEYYLKYWDWVDNKKNMV